MSSERSSPSSRRISVSASRPVAAIVSRAAVGGLGSCAAAYLAAVGLHHDHRQAVRHHVVHLAGDPGPLVRAPPARPAGPPRARSARRARPARRRTPRRMRPSGAQRPRGDARCAASGQEVRRDSPSRTRRRRTRRSQSPSADRRADQHRPPARPPPRAGGRVAGHRVERDRERHLAPQRLVDAARPGRRWRRRRPGRRRSGGVRRHEQRAICAEARTTHDHGPGSQGKATAGAAAPPPARRRTSAAPGPSRHGSRRGAVPATTATVDRGRRGVSPRDDARRPRVGCAP